MKRLLPSVFLLFQSFAAICAAHGICAADPTDALGLKTVVIDAGHGGKDPGAVSRDGKTYEKTFTLDIAKRLSKRIKDEYPDVKVILTRSDDRYVVLDNRADIANKANANLFISIHINANSGSSANGYSVHVLGQSSRRDLYAGNMDVCARENSVIKLEDDYSTKYQGFDPSDPESYIFMSLMQNANLEQSLSFAQTVSSKLAEGPIKHSLGVSQDPFLVLWKTAMPAVLVEMGFISNASDLAILRSERERDRMADCLFKAFKEYKTVYDKSMKTEAAPQAEVKSEAQSGAVYGVQIFAGANLLKEGDPAFKGYKPLTVKSGKLYVYVIGMSESLEQVKVFHSEVKDKFPGSYLVKVEGNSISRP